MPAVARARVDFHLVPEQDPADIEAKVRSHLDAHGFGEVELRVGGPDRPAPACSARRSGRGARGRGRRLRGAGRLPAAPGRRPGARHARRARATTVSPAGTTRLTSGLHGPNEHGAVADYLDHVRFTLRLLEELSQSGAA